MTADQLPLWPPLDVTPRPSGQWEIGAWWRDQWWRIDDVEPDERYL